MIKHTYKYFAIILICIINSFDQNLFADNKTEWIIGLKEDCIILQSSDLKEKEFVCKWKKFVSEKDYRPEILKAEWVEKNRLIKIWLYLDGYNSNHLLNMLVEFETKKIQFCQRISPVNWATNLNDSIVFGDSNSKYKENLSTNEYYNKIVLRASECIGQFSYYPHYNSIYKIGCSNNNRYELRSSKLEKSFYDNVSFCKFCRYGIKSMDLSNDHQQLIFSFYKEKSLFHWKNENISEIIEYNLINQSTNVIIQDGRNPSYSNDKNKILYEKINARIGFNNIKSYGYYLFDRETKNSIFIENYLSARLIN